MSTRTSIRCDRCGFDMGNSLGKSGLCAGCGIPLGPASDHDRPAPGFTVRADDPHIVTDADRERYPELRGVRVVKSCKFTWYAGIGAEPTHGYFLEQRTTLVDLTDFDPEFNFKYDDPAEFAPVGACPDCGSTTGKHSYSSNGYVGGESLECVACGHTFVDEFWD